jgi:hypothetical protein
MLHNTAANFDVPQSKGSLVVPIHPITFIVLPFPNVFRNWDLAFCLRPSPSVTLYYRHHCPISPVNRLSPSLIALNSPHQFLPRSIIIHSPYYLNVSDWITEHKPIPTNSFHLILTN